MNNKQYRVEYQNAFGFSPREEKIFTDRQDAEWFQRAMKRANFITRLQEVEE